MKKIENLIFDLDDTIYSQSSLMSQEIHDRIVGYTAKFFGFSVEKAEELRKTELKKHISTLEWLKANGLDDDGTEEYFSFVHPDGETSALLPDEKLRPFLESISLPKVILTNSPREHAEHVLDFFGIRDLFCPEISDIRMNDLKGKPFEVAFRNALAILNKNRPDSSEKARVSNSLFFDDYVPYLLGFTKLGGRGVLVGNAEAGPQKVGFFDVEKYNAERKAGEGKMYRIKDIYELPSLLEPIESEKDC